jgi:hypothetical protein
MSMEVSIAVIIKENTSEGSLISVMESETLMPPRCMEDLSQDELAASIYDQMFQQAELRAAVMIEAVKEKVDDQLRAHREGVRAGTHPMQH